MDYLYVMKRYKATLYHSKQDLNNKTITEPVDSILLDEKCYRTAERHFFKDRAWDREHYDFHIEFEKTARTLA